MLGTLYDLKAPKKSVNLSLNGDLLRQAKALGVNLSRFAEEKLADEVRRRRGEAWRAENRGAIEAYNKRLAAGETFGAEHRRF
jgi:antitoxin CcdA